MKRLSFLSCVALLCALVIANSVSALVTNGSFESGVFAPWTVSNYRNNGFSSAPGSGGTILSTIVSGAGPLTQSDPRTNGAIQYPAYGSRSARVNSEASYTGGGYGRNGNMISQTLAAYVDPSDSRVHTKFAYAAVMVNPISSPHTDSEKPYFRVRVINTDNADDVLYEFASYVNEPGKNWQDGAVFSNADGITEYWKYLNWQVIDLASTPEHPVNAGDDIRIEVSAAGCSLGGHPGYVYVDEITDNEIAGPTVKAAGPATIGSGADITYTYTYRNGYGSPVDPTVTVDQPAGVTFTSVSDTTNCSLAGGTVTCNFVGVPSATSGSFTVTGTVTAATGTQLAHGSYRIAATGFPTVDGQTVLTDVTTVSTATSVASSVNPSVYGENVTFTATVSPTSGTATPTGSVQFQIDGVNAGSPVALSGGTAQIGRSNLSIGNHTVSAVYSPGAGFTGSTGTLTGGQTVAKADSSTAVTSSPDPSVYGQNVTLTATVGALAPGSGLPTGTIQFLVDGSPLGSPVSLSAGVAQISTANMSVGGRAIGATYSGDANFNGSTASDGHTVSAAATTTSVGSSLPTSTYGQSVTFTATVAAAAPGSGTPGGTVSFFDGAAPIAGCQNLPLNGSGQAQCPVVNLTGGAHTINVTYNGGPSHDGSSGSAGQTVNKAALAVTASSHSVIYGDAAPSVSPSYGAFVLGQNASHLTAQPTCSTVYTAGSTVAGSPYATSCSGGVSDNYEFSYVGGTVSVARAAVTVTASSHNVTFGDAVPTVTPSYSGFVLDQGPAVLSSSPACSTAYFVGASVPGAPYSTSCSGAAAANYSFSYVNGSVGVTPANLTVTASSHSVTYGGAAPTVTPSYTGFVANQTAADLAATASCSTTYAAGSPVAGSPYVTSCSGAASPNYTIVYVNGSLTVARAELSVTASSHSVTYGDAAPMVTPSYSGFVLGQGPGDLTAQPACSTTYAAGSSVAGSPYSTSCSGAASPNYTISYVNGGVSVARAGFTVTASSHSVTYGDSVPTVSPSYAGFVLGHGPGALTSQPACSTNYLPGATVAGSPYATSCSGANSGNYTITYVNGSVTVARANLTVTASSHSVRYGDAVPTVTPSYAGFVLNQTASDLNTAPTCSTTYAAGSPVAGSPYPTSCSGAVSSNYTISYVNGSVSVARADLTVTASSHSLTYGDAAPSVTPSYTGFVLGHGAGDLTSQPGCSTNYSVGSTVAGSPYSTSCTGAASPNYAITYTNGSVSVAKAALTVTAPGGTVTYGDAVPSLAPTYSGFVLGQGPANLDALPVCTTTLTAASSVTGSPFIASCSAAASGNYAFDYVDGQFTVAKRPLTVRADDLARTYGSTNPTLTASFAGFAPGQTLATSGVTGTPGLQTSAMPQSPVGDSPYAIVASLGSLQSSNYSFVFQNGQLTIQKAQLTVKAVNKTRPYGVANPALTVEFWGFVNNETLPTSGVNGSAVVETTAAASSSVGLYPITAATGTLTSGNYGFAFLPGTLTVTKARTVTVITNGSQIHEASTRVGQPYTVSWSTQAETPGFGTLTGNVTVRDGSGTACTAPVAAGSCEMVSLVPGLKSITAAYAGDDNFLASTSAGVFHPVVLLIAGNVKDRAPFGPPVSLQGVTLTIQGSISGQTISDANGNYVFASNVPAGNYRVTATGLSRNYDPPSRSYTNVTDNITNADFLAYTGPLVNPSPTPVVTPSATPTPVATPTPSPQMTPTPTASPSPTPDGGVVGGEGDVVDGAGVPMGGDGVKDNDLDVVRGFAVGSSEPDAGVGQFQRGDTAPRESATGTFGDGAIDASDVTIVRLYMLGMLPGTMAAGPLQPNTPAIVPSTGLRRIRAVSVGTKPGAQVTMQFVIESQGDEASASFTFNFDKNVLSNPVVSLGSGVAGGTNLTVNDQFADEGRVGVLVDSVERYATGTRHVISVRFDVSPSAQIGMYPVTFTDGPTVKSVSSNTGVLLPTTYQLGYVQIGSSSADVSVAGRVTNAAGIGLRNVVVTLSDPSGVRRSATTGSFGSYRFDGVAPGRSYVLAAAAKRYRFSARVLNVTDQIADANFTALE